MRVLITGGAGFIGTNLGQRMADHGHEITVLDNLHPQVHGKSPRPTVPGRLIKGDITDPGTVADVVRDPFDLIVHLAAETGTGQSLDQASRHALVNVVGTTCLLDALSRARKYPTHMMLTSSRAVYGEGEWSRRGTNDVPRGGGIRSPRDLEAGHWLPHGVPDGWKPLPSSARRTLPAPTSVYGATKLAQEHVLRAWCVARGVAVSVLRLQNVYGPGQSPINPYSGVMTLFARLALEGKPVPVYEDGAIVRDFVHVDDVVSAVMAACERLPEAPRLLDVGSGRATTLLDVATLIMELVGGSSPVVTGQFRLGDVRAAQCDIEPTERELAWKPTTRLETGVKGLVEWISQKGP